MSNQYPQQPQQPGWNGPQYPQQPQPGWGTPPPQPPKKSNVGKILGFGCLGFVAVIVLIGAIGAIASSSGNSSNSSSNKAASPTKTATAPAGKAGGHAKSAAPSKAAAKTVVFKVWGTAPAGALGGLDIMYGSDSDTRKGTFKNGTFEATLPLKKDALYYSLTAQLQGSGDVNCSVTVDGHTKKGHASGGYNICDAQLSADLLGGWEG